MYSAKSKIIRNNVGNSGVSHEMRNSWIYSRTTAKKVIKETINHRYFSILCFVYMYTVKEAKGNNQPSGVPLILCHSQHTQGRKTLNVSLKLNQLIVCQPFSMK